MSWSLVWRLRPLGHLTVGGSSPTIGVASSAMLRFVRSRWFGLGHPQILNSTFRKPCNSISRYFFSLNSCFLCLFFSFLVVFLHRSFILLNFIPSKLFFLWAFGSFYNLICLKKFLNIGTVLFYFDLWIRWFFFSLAGYLLSKIIDYRFVALFLLVFGYGFLDFSIPPFLLISSSPTHLAHNAPSSPLMIDYDAYAPFTLKIFLFESRSTHSAISERCSIWNLYDQFKLKGWQGWPNNKTISILPGP